MSDKEAEHISNKRLLLLLVLAGTVLFVLFNPIQFSYLSGKSMEPTLEPGGIVIHSEQDSYEVGEIIVFYDGEKQIGHRIIDETPRGFVTKGDNNSYVDYTLVTEDMIRGEIIYYIEL